MSFRNMNKNTLTKDLFKKKYTHQKPMNKNIKWRYRHTTLKRPKKRFCLDVAIHIQHSSSAYGQLQCLGIDKMLYLVFVSKEAEENITYVIWSLRIPDKPCYYKGPRLNHLNTHMFNQF